MALENTDKALASLIDTAKELSTQMSPTVYDAASKVALLNAQGDLRTALIWLIISALASALAGALFIFLIVICAKNREDAIGACIGVFMACLVAFCVSLASYTNPLNRGLASDPNLALAYEVMQKIR